VPLRCRFVITVWRGIYLLHFYRVKPPFDIHHPTIQDPSCSSLGLGSLRGLTNRETRVGCSMDSWCELLSSLNPASAGPLTHL
jgi:hypothetical protein